MSVQKKKLDRVAEASSRNYAHHSSAEVYARIRVLQAELDEVTSTINAATATLVNHRERRAKLDAEIRGLTAVVERR
jgi:hypothetical protein